METIPSRVVALRLGSGAPADLESLAKSLRQGRPAVFTRIHKDAMLFDLRTIQPDEDADIIDAIQTGVRS